MSLSSTRRIIPPMIASSTYWCTTAVLLAARLTRLADLFELGGVRPLRATVTSTSMMPRLLFEQRASYASAICPRWPIRRAR